MTSQSQPILANGQTDAEPSAAERSLQLEADHQRRCAVEWFDKYCAAKAESGDLRAATKAWIDYLDAPDWLAKDAHLTERRLLDAMRAALAKAGGQS